MISIKPVPSLFNRIESYRPVSITEVVSYLHRTTSKRDLVVNDGLYGVYTLPLWSASTGVENFRVLLDSTEPYFGGVRYWFVCEHCRRRAVNMYYARQVLACRRCLGLEYSSRIYGGSPLCSLYTKREKAMKLMMTRRLTYRGRPTRAGRRVGRLIGVGTHNLSL